MLFHTYHKLFEMKIQKEWVGNLKGKNGILHFALKV